MAYWHQTLGNTKVQKKSQTSARPPPSLRLVMGSRSATPLAVSEAFESKLVYCIVWKQNVKQIESPAIYVEKLGLILRRSLRGCLHGGCIRSIQNLYTLFFAASSFLKINIHILHSYSNASDKYHMIVVEKQIYSCSHISRRFQILALFVTSTQN